jgi:hypothetical protein
MRDERLVFVLARALGKRLGGVEIAVMQAEKYTEWHDGDRGFAVGPHVTSYPPKALLETMVTYFTPKRPVRTKDL